MKQVTAMFRLSRILLQVHVRRRFYSSDSSDLHGTLHSRFFNHLKQNKQIEMEPNISKMIQTLNGNTSTNSPDFIELYKQVDKECVESIRRSSSDIFDLVDALIIAVPGRVANMKTFSVAIKMLLSRFQSNPIKEDFVKLGFYLGLFKKNPPGPIVLAALIEDHLDTMIDANMSTIDFAIICTATFKASVRITSEKFEHRLIQEIVGTEKVDEFIFGTFIKSLRMNRINSDAVIGKLRHLCNTGEFDQTAFVLLVNIYAFFADNFIKDLKLSEFFIERCVDTIGKDTRAKDVQKLLYSCALLNHPLKDDHLKTMEQQVMARANHTEFKRKFDNFVDVALSLWILNYRPRELVDKLLKDSRFTAPEDKSRIKIDSRKKLLLSCIEIEEPAMVQDLKNTASPSFDEERPAPLYLIRPSIKNHLVQLRGKNVKIVQQVKHLNIAGILVKEANGRHYHIEVIDKTNSLSDKTSPNGIFALKLRLMEKMNCVVKVVSCGCINIMDSLMSRQFLLIIGKFCIMRMALRGPSHKAR